jgi:hypothetical protein
VLLKDVENIIVAKAITPAAVHKLIVKFPCNDVDELHSRRHVHFAAGACTNDK